MGVRVAERVSFEDRPDEFGVTLEELVEHLAIVNVVATTRARAR